jgi:hypothetical protein
MAKYEPSPDGESCPYCQRSVPADASVCPHCGAEKFKKLNLVEGLITIALGLFVGTIIGNETWELLGNIVKILFAVLGIGAIFSSRAYFWRK